MGNGYRSMTYMLLTYLMVCQSFFQNPLKLPYGETHMSKSALILVDLQNDFFPGGALGVPDADGIFPLANNIQTHFDLILATKDWHPQNHGSFASNHPGKKVYDEIQLKGIPQILWPDHCVQNSKGAEFHPNLQTEKIKKVFLKGTDPDYDSYSTFFDNAHIKNTGLEQYLKEQEVADVYIMGLATDYCVLFSVLDSQELGFKTFVIVDGCFGINKSPGDVDRALEKMKNKGAKLIFSKDLYKYKEI